jgi:membrane protein required for colicin V production
MSSAGACAVADFILITALAASFVVGVWRGALRQLLAIGGWLVTFVVAVQVRGPIADWLGPQQPQLSRPYVEMVAYLLAFCVLFVVLTVIIEAVGRRIDLSSRPLLDDIAGGVLGVVVAVLVVGSLIIIVDSYYGAGYPASPELDIVRSLYAGLISSNIGHALHEYLVPGLLALLSLLLPSDVVHPGS